jgi:hypothetical protein
MAETEVIQVFPVALRMALPQALAVLLVGLLMAFPSSPKQAQAT